LKKVKRISVSIRAIEQIDKKYKYILYIYSMQSFYAIIERFGEMGEKTNWYYIIMPDDVMQILQATKTKSLRVKGLLDAVPIKMLALWPIGEAQYILPLNATIRKQLHKDVEHSIHLQIEIDNDEIGIAPELYDCLQDEPLAMQRFYAMNKSWQNNFSRMVNDAKTPATKAKRIAKFLEALIVGDTHEKMMEVIRRKE
jgi:Domain of unknown function (DUF1905)/Bacteriocin-protection, YdeI or OmpD-Associated